MEKDELFMEEALEEAKKAFSEDEIPVGAVIVKDDEIIGRGHNSCERERLSLCHAEINAIADASKTTGSQRLLNCTMYVTLEPCPMCAGAILNSRIERVVFALGDCDFGAMGGLIDLSKLQPLKGPSLKKGVLERESRELLEKFFSKIRQ